MTRYQRPNPLDLLFFAGDRAFRACGQPGAHVLLMLELDGRLSADALRQSLAELARFCPALNGRLATTPFSRHACWRLDAPPGALADAVCERDDLAPGHASHAWLETLLMTPMDLAHRPPVQFHVLHRLDGDLLVMQWPHALMDGRGMLLMIDALGGGGGERFAGDEARTDFAVVLRRGRKPAAGRSTAAFPRGPTRLLASMTPSGAAPRMSALLHHLSPEETERVAANARTLTRSWPSGRYIRACAIQAVHEHVPPAIGEGVYRVHALVDCRPDPNAAVCWNLSAPLRLGIPSAIAHSRRLISDELHRQMKQHNADRAVGALFRQLGWLGLLPTSAAGYLLRPTVSLRPAFGGRSLLPPVTLAADLLPPLDRPLERFLGLRVANYYHIPTIPPRPGLALFATHTGQRLNTTCVWYEPTVPRELARRVLTRFIELLLEPP